MNKALGPKTGIKFDQVWRAAKDYKIPEKWSPQKDCVIPRGTRAVVLNTPILGAKNFFIMPLTSKGIDKRLVPDLKQMETAKEGFGVSIDIEHFKRYFVLDDDQKIVFDNADVKEFWETIKARRLTPKETKEWDRFISENFPQKIV